MPKARSSMEARIVEWFRQAPLEVAESLLGIIQADLRPRRPKALTKPAKRVAKKKTNALPQASGMSGNAVIGEDGPHT